VRGLVRVIGESKALRDGGRWRSGGGSDTTPLPGPDVGLDVGGGGATKDDSGLGGGVGGRIRRAPPGLETPLPGKGGKLTVARVDSRPSLCIL